MQLNPGSSLVHSSDALLRKICSGLNVVASSNGIIKTKMTALIDFPWAGYKPSPLGGIALAY